jgi:hypothetical protein
MKVDWMDIKEKLAVVAARYGAAVAIAVSLPFAAYLAGQGLVPPERWQPMLFAERPGDAAVRSEEGPSAPVEPVTPHIAPPEVVRGIYVSAATAGYKKRFNELIALADRTEVNAFVIDIKNGNGEIAFAPETEALKPYAEKRPSLGNLKEFTAPLHDKGIYLIARLFVFQDPFYAERNTDIAVGRKGGGIWRDRKGVPWVDPAADKAWKYNAAIAREAWNGGFDEIQFDYIRFPTDGNLSLMEFPAWDGKKTKAEVMGEFFKYLDAELREKRGIPLSVDLFGLTMWEHNYDLNIGQRIDVAAKHFDFISPMVYPSHYPAGFNKYANPAARPYEVIRDNMARGKILFDRLGAESAAYAAEHPGVPPPRIATVRPWLQDFDLGADYTPAMVRGQITASMEGGATGWLLWNARNVYTEAALLPEPVEKKSDQ